MPDLVRTYGASLATVKQVIQQAGVQRARSAALRLAIQRRGRGFRRPKYPHAQIVRDHEEEELSIPALQVKYGASPGASRYILAKVGLRRSGRGVHKLH